MYYSIALVIADHHHRSNPMQGMHLMTNFSPSSHGKSSLPDFGDFSNGRSVPNLHFHFQEINPAYDWARIAMNQDIRAGDPPWLPPLANLNKLSVGLVRWPRAYPARSLARSRLSARALIIRYTYINVNAGEPAERDRRFVATDNRPSSSEVLEFRIRPLEYHRSIDSLNVRSQNSPPAKRDFISARYRPH